MASPSDQPLAELPQQGLYTPELEHDACGIGSIVHLKGKKSYRLVRDALLMLRNMEHRGATGSDPLTGDGAGILTQLPHRFFRAAMARQGVRLPAEGRYGVGVVFFPQDARQQAHCRQLLNSSLERMGFRLLGYRLVPVVASVPGQQAQAAAPHIEQVFVQADDKGLEGEALERKLYVLRKRTLHEANRTAAGAGFYMPSFSARTIVYKGQLKTDQLEAYYPDLQHPLYRSALAVVHSRFSTNTFPNWRLAQPFRFIAHNGEINTIRGNVNKMVSKQSRMHSALFTDEELAWLLPVTDPGFSDSANLDGLVELLTLAGRPLPHVMMMLVPEAWQDNRQMDPRRKAFYKYHAALMEPWDGPAALFFTDGRQVGACLDRNGLRPVRYCLTRNGRLIMASEAGALPVAPRDVLKRGRLQPGKMLLADTLEGRMLEDEEIKELVCRDKPYLEWIRQNRLKLRLMPDPQVPLPPLPAELLQQQLGAFGYTEEDLKMIIRPMAAHGKEPVGSMGADAPLAVLSRQPQHVANYFKQFFAQVSNPPIDPLRERLVMSLFTRLGEAGNLLDESPEHTRQIHLSQPVLSHQDFYKLLHLDREGYPYQLLDATFALGEEQGLRNALDRLCKEAEAAVKLGKKILILSNRGVQAGRLAVPSLLAIGAVHHHLILKRLRTKTGLVIEAGDAWETHHVATIIGYGASAVYPYLAYATIEAQQQAGKLDRQLPLDRLLANYIEAMGGGLLKILSKMGISTLQSYQGSQIFECVGLGREVIELCFKGTTSRLGGLGFAELEQECLLRHQAAYNPAWEGLEPGGYYQWRRSGETHLLQPQVIHYLQKSTRLGNYALYKEYSRAVRQQQQGAVSLRNLLEFRYLRPPVPLEEVEPASALLKRFATGAMSFGSISHEAHSTLAIAMNRIGGKSNSGEGGEDEARYTPRPNGDSERSAIKQVASGRFGVTSHYLANADELQIKIAQGAKPGEG
ncbi:glutamate synthase central domain-containing protein, partial [Cesiribacter andamanensis]|uniref:glutamate synthase central domain-containing protein n=1 Tax=Cesiribacter andamanensis TaxID=649507 RepID=UPI001F3C554B